MPPDSLDYYVLTGPGGDKYEGKVLVVTQYRVGRDQNSCSLAITLNGDVHVHVALEQVISVSHNHTH